MDKDEDETDSNNGQEEANGHQIDLNDPCYIQMCRASAQLLQMLTQMDMCNSTQVEALELESLSDETESDSSSASTSNTSSTHGSMSDEGNYIIWAEPIMTCRLLPARNNTLADVRKIPAGSRRQGQPEQTTNSCGHNKITNTTENSTPARISETNNNKIQSDAIFTEALKRMASAAETIRLARSVLSSITSNRQSNNNNNPDNAGGDDKKDTSKDVRDEDPQRDEPGGSTSKSGTLPAEQDSRELDSSFPEPILVRSYVTTEHSRYSGDNNNFSMGDSVASRSHNSGSQQLSPRYNLSIRARPNGIATSWSSNMFDSDYQAARMARHPRVYGNTYRHLADPQPRDDFSLAQGTRASGLNRHQPKAVSSPIRTTHHEGINYSMRNKHNESICLPQCTKTSSAASRNKITIADFKDALDLAIHNLEKNDVWMSYSRNLYSGDNGGSKVCSNSFNLSHITTTSPSLKGQGNTPQEHHTACIASFYSQASTVIDKDTIFKDNKTNGHGSELRSEQKCKKVTPIITQEAKPLGTFKSDANIASKPSSRATSSKLKKTVGFFVPPAVEISDSDQRTCRSEVDSGITQRSLSTDSCDVTVVVKTLEDGSEDVTIVNRSGRYFKPIYFNVNEASCCGSQMYDNLNTNLNEHNGTDEEHPLPTPIECIISIRPQDYNDVTEDVKISVLAAADNVKSLGNECNMTKGDSHSVEKQSLNVFGHNEFLTGADWLRSSPVESTIGGDELEAKTIEDNMETKDMICGDIYSETTVMSAVKDTDQKKKSNIVCITVCQDDIMGGESRVTCDYVETVMKVVDLTTTGETETLDVVECEDDEETPTMDEAEVTSLQKGLKLRETDDEVTMISASISVSNTSVTLQVRNRSRSGSSIKRHFSDRHFSEFFEGNDLDLLDEPLVISDAELTSKRPNSTNLTKVVLKTEEPIPEAATLKDHNSDLKMVEVDKESDLKPILALGLQKTFTATPNRIFAHDLELISVASDDQMDDQEEKKVTWDKVPDNKPGDEQAPATQSWSGVSGDGDKKNDQHKETSDELKAKPQPMRQRIRKIFRSCFKRKNK